MDKNLDDRAKEFVYEQKERLEPTTEIEIPDTFENLPLDFNQLKKIIIFQISTKFPGNIYKL
ncbi:hypothetical protein J2Y02_004305 [Neobacillus drentensis]|nr:hypothetical protein [Neobacillus drentensis]